MKVTGFHHVTCIGSQPQTNLEFYGGVLGLRLLKRTVHFDHENVYHLYYGDETGTPGSILTFFPFPRAEPAVRGSDSIQEVSLAIPAGSRSFWKARLEAYRIDVDDWMREFDQDVLRFRDHDGQRLKLVSVDGCETRPRWSNGMVGRDRAIRGLQGIRLGVTNADAELTALTSLLGLSRHGHERGVTRLVFASGQGTKRYVDVEDMSGVARAPGVPLEGAPALAGTVNHVAFGTEDETSQRAFRDALLATGLTVTPIKDRMYFKSIYMLDVSGIRVEIATDRCAGFAIDEPPDQLGGGLCLPPWLEHLRPKYEALLPELRMPTEIEAEG